MSWALKQSPGKTGQKRVGNHFQRSSSPLTTFHGSPLLPHRHGQKRRRRRLRDRLSNQLGNAALRPPTVGRQAGLGQVGRRALLQATRPARRRRPCRPPALVAARSALRGPPPGLYLPSLVPTLQSRSRRHHLAAEPDANRGPAAWVRPDPAAPGVKTH